MWWASFPSSCYILLKDGRSEGTWPWRSLLLSPVCCHSCIPLSVGAKYWGSRNWEWKFLAMLMKVQCSFAVFSCKCTWVLEKSGISVTGSVPWNSAYVRRRTVKIFFCISNSNSMRAEQAQLVPIGLESRSKCWSAYCPWSHLHDFHWKPLSRMYALEGEFILQIL